jgi:ATP-dependent exoDNAse (exonuclease V) beta subunit
MSEPAEGLRQHEAWRAARNQRIAAGVNPEFRLRRITEAEDLPEGMSAGEVEIIRLDVPAIAASGRKRGRKYGDLVHALLAHAEFPADRTGLEAQATAHEIGSRMTAADRQQTVDTVIRTLTHKLVSGAFTAQRMHREYPVTYEANGELYEGVIDLVWFDGTRWTVVDYKTGPGDEPRYRRQIAIYGEVIRKTTGAPVRLIVLEIA